MKKIMLFTILIGLLFILACTEDNGNQLPIQDRIKGEGEMCGGIAGFICEEGLTCSMEGDYPDASGICVKSSDSEKGSYEVDYSCSKDEDCTVKNVGNCCGYYPKCVNVDSETFPEKVKEDCQKKGMVSVCGFPNIEECVCIKGLCEAK